MASPEHNNLHWNWPEEEISLSSAEERPWLKPLVRVVAIMLSLIGGFTILCLTISNVDFQGWGFLIACLLGVAGTLLFRSWWALLVVPLSFTLGEFLGWYLAPVVFSPDPRFFTDDVAFGVFFGVGGGAILATMGAVIGTAFVKARKLDWLE
jgi:hypothetical protein